MLLFISRSSNFFIVFISVTFSSAQFEFLPSQSHTHTHSSFGMSFLTWSMKHDSPCDQRSATVSMEQMCDLHGSQGRSVRLSVRARVMHIYARYCVFTSHVSIPILSHHPECARSCCFVQRAVIPEPWRRVPLL